MRVRRPGRLLPGKTVALFVAVAAVSVAAVAWMGVRLLMQERALEERRLAERREAAADRAVAALQQVLFAEERRLANPRPADPAAGDDALVVVAGPAGMRVSPEGAALYYPVMPSGQGGSRIPLRRSRATGVRRARTTRARSPSSDRS